MVNASSHAAGQGFRPNGGHAQAWLPLGTAEARSRVIVFPHAGAGTAYYVRVGRALAEKGLAAVIVRYPGRETRLGEAPLESITELVDRLAVELAPLATGRFSFFGHSLGALVAFELAHAWRRDGGLLPERLWLSGRRPPQIPADVPHLHPLPDREFLDAVNRRYEALPAALLAEPELVALTLPVLRADFRIVETYTLRARPPLSVPITILRGAGDRWLDDRAAEGWAPHTTGATDERVFPGGHFYLDGAVPQLAQLVSESAGCPAGVRR